MTAAQVRAVALAYDGGRGLFGDDERDEDERAAFRIDHERLMRRDAGYRRRHMLCVIVGGSAPRVSTYYADADDPATRSRAVGIIRQLIARAEARR